jgi:hypothetical protein
MCCGMRKYNHPSEEDHIERTKKKCSECDDGFGYGYKKGKSKVYICYNCGKFEGVNFPESILFALLEEPSLLFHLLETGYLKPVK